MQEEDTKEVSLTRGDIKGRLLKITLPKGDPIFGEVVDVETGEKLALVCEVKFDLDMTRRGERIKSSVVARRRKQYDPTEDWPHFRMRSILEEVPVASIEDFSFTVRMAHIGKEHEEPYQLEKLLIYDNTQEEVK